MVKDIHNLEHDPTLAHSILTVITLPPLSSIFQTNFPDEVDQLINQINFLNDSNRGNEIDTLLEHLQLFRNSYSQKRKRLSADDQQQVESFLTNHLETFYELSFNSRHFNIEPQSITDAFTLNHTCYFITALNALIEDLSPTGFSVTQRKYGKSSSFYSEKTPYDLLKKELLLAMELKEFSESIRSQIGSPETMPRGLVITFMWHLCNAEHTCNCIYEEAMVCSRKLLAIIGNSIEEVRRNYPDLAEAGEDLHKAIANYQVPKG